MVGSISSISFEICKSFLFDDLRLDVFLICSFQGTHLFVIKKIFPMTNGDGEIRTLDPLLARQVLSQLSYTPKIMWQPPTLPCRLQQSTIGRLGLNRRVRDGNGCVP